MNINRNIILSNLEDYIKRDIPLTRTEAYEINDYISEQDDEIMFWKNACEKKQDKIFELLAKLEGGK